MPDRSFVHLHCHSHYSLLDGASRIPELIARVKSLGMNACALTDHGNLYGAIEFYRECKAAGVNPVIGYEAYVAPGKRGEREARRRGDAGYHLTLLARDLTGFKNLVKLASVAFLEGFHYVPRIDKEVLAAHHEGLICLSGCASGEFSELILKEDLAGATELAAWFARLFGDNFYIEIQNNGLQVQKRCAEGAITVADRLGLPLVATSDAHYLRQEDAPAHDVLLCINTGKTLADPNRMRYGDGDGKMVDQFYVCGPDEMYARFPGREDAVRRSQEIADRVAIELDFKKRHFPAFAPPGKKTPEQYLRDLCEEGMQVRYRGKPSRAARERLEHELGIICRMGFASYFLIVWDFVRFAREHSIPASARGSACGALVSYVLQLSHVDPLEYDLLFERFLDPSRSEAPDIDIDFCQDRREEVIAYVKQKYGEASVAQIATFGTMAARAAIKDVGRALDVPLDRVNFLTNLVPKTLHITLDDALAQEPELKKEYDTDPDVRRLIDIARKLEGTNRQSGIHAAGVVIANGPLTDYVPVHRAVRKGEDGGGRGAEPVVATQWVMGDLEKVGLLKMDFLGLRTLTLLDNALRLIEKTRGERIDLYQLPLDDPETYALLQRGDAKGVFQLENDGIRELSKRMKPDSFQDIIATIALYRPGPLQGGMVDAYVNRKHGREKPAYPHPALEEILGKTYGIMVYQEDVMRILNRLGGIELSSAYACIKAISKKKQDIIEQRRAEFLRGAVERGVREETAREIFDLITYFGGYGFNASHSAAYAMIAYQTAYLKAHYTPEFMAALLSSEIDDGNKRDNMVDHIADTRRLGVAVLPPDVNASEADFTVADGKIVFGLTALKGVGRAAALDVVRARAEGGPFRDFYDFCERVDGRAVTKAAIERLIKAGAFDRFGRRAQLWAVLPRALQAAAELQDDRRKGQRSLFDAFGEDGPAKAPAPPEALPDIPEWAETDKLKYEKEALDFYFSSHPLAQHEEDIRRFATHSVGQMAELADGQEVIMGGMLTAVRFRNTQKARNGNSRYVLCNIEDFTGSTKCVMWPDDLARHKDDLQDDRVCFIRATVNKRRDDPVLVLNRVLSIDEAKREQTKALWLQLSLAEHGERPEVIDQIARVLQRAPGTCPVFLHVKARVGKGWRVHVGEAFRINPATVAVGELETLLGPGSVKFAGPANGNGRTGK
jgi:DNA polymerase-3 subunit alpha